MQYLCGDCDCVCATLAILVTHRECCDKVQAAPKVPPVWKPKTPVDWNKIEKNERAGK